MKDLVQFIVDRYHATLRTELPALIALASVSNHGTRTSLVPARSWGTPRGRARGCSRPSCQGRNHPFPDDCLGHGCMTAMPIHVMEQEHEDHGHNLALIRTLPDNLTPPSATCPTWRALYLRLGALEAELMDHIHLENNILFPRALREMEGGAVPSEARA